MFDIDDVYKSAADKILNCFNTNYSAVSKYLKRLEYVYIIYRDNENLNQETIKNETGRYKINTQIHRIVNCLFFRLNELSENASEIYTTTKRCG